MLDFIRSWFPKKQGKLDKIMLGLAFILAIAGILVLFSASYAYGHSRFNDGYYFVKKQLRGFGIGLVFLLIVSRLDYKKIGEKKSLTVLYAIAIITLVLCFVPVIGGSDGVNDARRWIFLPFISFQPSEFAKFLIIIVEAGLISKMKPGSIRNSRKSLGLCAVIIAPIILLLFEQPNFSILMITSLTFASLLFFSGMRWRDIAVFGTIFIVVAGIGFLSQEYRFRRLFSFLNPTSEEFWDTGDQLRDSLYALGSGGIFGAGLGKSKMKFDFLAYGESDFILAIIGEEFGLVGLIVLIATYIALFYRGFRAAARARTRFGSLAAAGVTTLIALQTFVHIFVGVGLMPTTGVPLPFFSHGSSSLMAFMGGIGLLLSISRDSDVVIPAYGNNPMMISEYSKANKLLQK